MNGISLITATLNRTEELARFIQSLYPAENPYIDLIIVDQNQDSRIDTLLRQLIIPNHISIQHLKFDRNNQSLARNYGLTKARYDLIAFPDDDCWYEPDTLKQVITGFKAQADTSVIVGRWIEHPAKVPIKPITITAESLLNFRAIPTSAIIQFFRRRALPDTDPFDSRFGAYKEHGGYYGCGEETDLMMSIAKQRHSIVFTPTVRVHHLYTTRRFTSLRHQFSFIRHRARGTGGLYAKHGSTPYVVVRGILSPLVRSFKSVYAPDQFITQTALWIGRAEGFLRWRNMYVKESI